MYIIKNYINLATKLINIYLWNKQNEWNSTNIIKIWKGYKISRQRINILRIFEELIVNNKTKKLVKLYHILIFKLVLAV